jgi:hypothetical protein
MTSGPTTDSVLALERLFDGAREGLRAEVSADEYKRRRQDFVFHVTEVADDFAEMAQWLAHPDTLSDEEASTLVIGFLYHAVPHLNSAGRLLLDKIDDPFVEPAT